jgi:phosphoribosylanthranilate isomerase
VEGIVQIAGIRSKEEAKMLLDCGVDWLGFPLRLELHSEDMPAEEVGKIIASLGIRDRAVLITYLQDAAEITGLTAQLGCRRVQLHGDISAGETSRLKTGSRELYLIKALVIKPGNLGELLGTVWEFEPHIDAFITDTWDPQTGARGATGKTHDWDTSRRIAGSASRPVILAGGLNPDNVGQAIRKVGPAGVDAHTGVETPGGMKDPSLAKAFVEESRRAFDQLKRNKPGHE